MPKYLTSFLLLLILSIPAWTQDEDSAGQTADTAPPETREAVAEDDADDAADDAGDDEEIDDSDLDEQTYEADDDDFVPTEEIPADEPIPFPSNI